MPVASGGRSSLYPFRIVELLPASRRLPGRSTESFSALQQRVTGLTSTASAWARPLCRRRVIVNGVISNEEGWREKVLALADASAFWEQQRQLFLG